MKIGSTPAMDEGGLQAFTEYLSGVEVFLEYGCGASTIYAANHGVKTIISVDSASEWVTQVKEETKNLQAQVLITHCNVGEVGAWGKPIDDSLIRSYHQYPVLPWKIAKEKNIVPQLVLVDGRFRAACFLYSLVSCKVGTKILFDDYLNRSYYKSVEKFCKVSEERGRMAIFTVEKNFDFAEIMESFARYSIVKN